MKRRVIALLFAVILVVTGCNSTAVSKDGESKSSTGNTGSNETVEAIMARLTIEQKAAQMVQGAVYNITESSMNTNDYGSMLSTFGSSFLNAPSWKTLILKYQKSAVTSTAGIPYIYGNDAVHGVNTAKGTVIFPHNIGIGAANDVELSYQMGIAVANEAKLTGMLWSFSPCLAAAQDPRWGRTYESYSSQNDIVAKLGSSFAKGMIDGGVLPCAKHFLGDGNVLFGTGETLDGEKRLIDRGDAQLLDEEIKSLLTVYKSMVDTGVKTVMISHSSLNGTKMHENAKYINALKNDLGFDGFVVSDWDSIHNIPGANLKAQTVTAINAGIDMLMEDVDFEQCRKYIVESVKEGTISIDRVNDAVTRILNVKKEMGILDDPMMENVKADVETTGSQKYRDLARTLVEESLVLLKNDNKVLPIKKGTKIFVTGPAANDVGVQCGGWTLTWSGSSDADNSGKKWVSEGKTILDGLNALATTYELTIITDVNKAKDADMTLLCLGEKTYAEWNGDSADISITGKLGLAGNAEAIKLAKDLQHPTVACIVAGRNVIMEEYMNQWDGIVMCYLPGSEGDGVSNVLTGKSSFKGTLPMPYYSKVEDIRTDKVLFPVGYGLKY
ncbi:glycoside hydrolase family 3 protein [[Clostridium] fimetarium]|uniref:beta-glucosidase n=1 Tax=[Clostridium] fimetarium TaxID=99656 RepID=A0A1I0QAF7_9FIRM|nr:glycoside hydrolase family 3 protein [[Clostridium] fimetarium]SEW24025.1 beta-glucosidase [[Clostridium] fimetarium]